MRVRPCLRFNRGYSLSTVFQRASSGGKMNWVRSAMLATSVGISCMYYIRWKSRDIETPTVLPQISADDGKEGEEKEKKVSTEVSL